MGNQASRSVFGQELSELWRKEHDVPVIVSRAVEYLEENGLDEPDLFVAPCSTLIEGDVSREDASQAMKNPVLSQRHRKVSLIRAQCNKGQSSSVDFAEHNDPHVAAGVVKLFFQNMRTPLLLDSLYENWIEAAAQENALARVTAFRSLFRSLPDSHQVLLAYILRFFIELLSEEHAVNNRLTREKLAAIFAPRFLRRRVQGLRADLAHTMATDHHAENQVAVSLIEFFSDVVQHTNEDVVVRLQRENASLRELAGKQQAVLKRLRAQREGEIRKTLVLLMRRSYQSNKMRHFHAWRRHVQQSLGRTAVHERLRIALDALEDKRAMRERHETEIAALRERLDLERFKVLVGRGGANGQRLSAAASVQTAVRDADDMAAFTPLRCQSPGSAVLGGGAKGGSESVAAAHSLAHGQELSAAAATGLASRGAGGARLDGAHNATHTTISPSSRGGGREAGTGSLSALRSSSRSEGSDWQRRVLGLHPDVRREGW